MKDFLPAMSSLTPHTLERIAVKRFYEGPAYYWPLDMQEQEQPPIEVRVIRLAGYRKADVWLMTNGHVLYMRSTDTKAGYEEWAPSLIEKAYALAKVS